MKITEAIVIAQKALIDRDQYFTHQELKALSMAVDGLYEIINARSNNYYTPVPVLPGETPE